MLSISYQLNDDGFTLFVYGQAFRQRYPLEIWDSFPHKAAYLSELLFVSLISLSYLSRKKEIHFAMPEPRFLQDYTGWLNKDLPALTDHIWYEPTWFVRRHFRKVRYHFDSPSLACSDYQLTDENKVVLPFSLGADSLTSLAIAREAELSPIGVFVTDPSRPADTLAKRAFLEQLEENEGFKTYTIEDELAQLLEPGLWRQPETNLTVALTFPRMCLLALPFAYHFGARYIVPGVERDYDVQVHLKKGHATAHVEWFRSLRGLLEMDRVISAWSGGFCRVTSLIYPLHDAAKFSILHQGHPELAMYQLTCDNALDSSDYGRWCHRCSACAHNYLYLVAMGFSPEEYEFQESMFSRSKRKFFDLFSQKNKQSSFFFEQEILCFLLAKQRGQQGWMVDYFTKHFLCEASTREKELRERYLSIVQAPENPLPLYQKATDAAERLLQQTHPNELWSA